MRSFIVWGTSKNLHTKVISYHVHKRGANYICGVQPLVHGDGFIIVRKKYIKIFCVIKIKARNKKKEKKSL